MTGLVVGNGIVVERETDHVVTDADRKDAARSAILEKLAATDAGMARVAEELAAGNGLSQAAKDRVALRQSLRKQLAALEN